MNRNSDLPQLGQLCRLLRTCSLLIILVCLGCGLETVARGQDKTVGDAGHHSRTRRQAAAAAPLRITFYHLPSENATASVGGNLTRIDAVLNATRDWAAATLTVNVPSPQPLRVSRECLGSVVYRRLASDRRNRYFCRIPNQCRNVTSCGPVVPEVPAEHLDRCWFCLSVQGLFTCDGVGGGTGLQNSDIVIYVVLDCTHVSAGRLAAGGSCSRYAVTDRPNAGWLAVCPSRFSDDPDALPYQVAEVSSKNMVESLINRDHHIAYCCCVLVILSLRLK